MFISVLGDWDEQVVLCNREVKNKTMKIHSFCLIINFSSVTSLTSNPFQKNHFLQRSMLKTASQGLERGLSGLRALAVLPEDMGSIPSTHMAAHNCP